MTSEFNIFGSPERFQISIAWSTPSDPVERQPKNHGWSMGSLAFTVGGENLMTHRVGDQTQDRLVWYLGPLLKWFADNWIPLFHEEHFPWRERSEDPAAAVCGRAIARFAAVGDGMKKSALAAEAWYHRHGVASAASGGLFPDIFFRRFGDDAEISWTASPPQFAPDGFTFVTEPGLARLAVADVAEPVWQMLCWAKDCPPPLETQEAICGWEQLAQRIEAIKYIGADSFTAADVAEALLVRVRASFQEKGRNDLLTPEVASSARYAVAEAPAVAMFGGVSVDLSDADINILRDALIASANGNSTDLLQNLVDNTPQRGKPWQDGYDLAENCLDKLENAEFDLQSTPFVDVRAVCQLLDISVKYMKFDTESMRGVALAGDSYFPSIFVNTRSIYNKGENGRRFTIAHEFCHILHDQSRAKRLAHTSGPWAAPGIEKRANAFAAWLLMPPRLLRLYLEFGAKIHLDRLREIADKLHVADRALVEHLYNLTLIDEVEREELRSASRNQWPDT